MAPTAKHELLSTGVSDGPKRFVFVIDQAMLGKVEVPLFAGLMTAEKHGKRVRINLLNNAPDLHRQKFDNEQIQHAKSVFYYRYWDLRRKEING